jgi:hypothetical protein
VAFSGPIWIPAHDKARSGFFDVWGMHFDPVNRTTVGKLFQVTAFDKPNLMISRRIEGAELSVTRDRMALLMKRALAASGCWTISINRTTKHQERET